jgi:hypothetical protein
MADPVTLSAIGIGASAGGSLLGAAGNIFSGQANSSMYSYQAGVAKVNQQIALQNADYSTAVGEVQAQQSGMKTAAEIGTTKATQGASGIDVNTGSAAAVRTSEEQLGEENQAIIRSDAAKRAYGYEVEAQSQGASANMYSAAASNSKTSGLLGAFGSILGGVSSVSSKWLSASSTGAIGGSGGSNFNPAFGTGTSAGAIY